MDGTLKFFVVEIVLDGLDRLQGNGLTGFALEHQKAQRTDFKLFRIRVFHLGSRPDLATQRAFHNRLQGRFAPDRKRLRLHQKIIVQIKRGFHMGDSMVLRPFVKFVPIFGGLVEGVSTLLRQQVLHQLAGPAHPFLRLEAFREVLGTIPKFPTA